MRGLGTVKGSRERVGVCCEGSCEGISVFGFESVSVGMKLPGVEGFFLGISEGENGRDREMRAGCVVF